MLLRPHHRLNKFRQLEAGRQQRQRAAASLGCIGIRRPAAAHRHSLHYGDLSNCPRHGGGRAGGGRCRSHRYRYRRRPITSSSRTDSTAVARWTNHRHRPPPSRAPLYTASRPSVRLSRRSIAAAATRHAGRVNFGPTQLFDNEKPLHKPNGAMKVVVTHNLQTSSEAKQVAALY